MFPTAGQRSSSKHSTVPCLCLSVPSLLLKHVQVVPPTLSRLISPSLSSDGAFRVAHFNLTDLLPTSARPVIVCVLGLDFVVGTYYFGTTVDSSRVFLPNFAQSGGNIFTIINLRVIVN